MVDELVMMVNTNTAAVTGHRITQKLLDTLWVEDESRAY